MNLFNLSNNNLDEVVFEQRNKAYGAYAIRKSYPDTLNKSMALTLSPLLFLLIGALVWNHFHPIPIGKFLPAGPVTPKKPITDVITCGGGFTFILDDPSGAFEIVIDKKVKPIVKKKEVIKPIERVMGMSSNKGLPGLPQMGGFGIPGMPGGGGGGIGKVADPEPMIIDITAEKMPVFPGGQDAMYEYIRKNLNYPRMALENGVSGKVVISFVVMPDGSIQMSNLERGIGFGCDDEALRVIREMPDWEPAQQNGRKVPIRMFLPVVFQTVN